MSRSMSDERVKEAELAKNLEVSYPPKINCAYCPALSPESFFNEKDLNARKEFHTIFCPSCIAPRKTRDKTLRP